jgi:hypothetical protein
MAEDALFNPVLYCNVDDKVAKANVRRVGYSLGCKWQGYYIDCPTTNKPSSLQITDKKQKEKHEVFKPILSFF